MPFTPAQNKLFRAAANNQAIAKSSGIPQAKAAKMAHEGVKGKPKALAKAIRAKGSSMGGIGGASGGGGVGGM